MLLNLKIYIVSLSKNEKTRTLSLKYLPELAGKIKNFITVKSEIEIL